MRYSAICGSQGSAATSQAVEGVPSLFIHSGGEDTNEILFRFFDCWWALFGNRAAENNDEGHSVC